MGRVISVVSGKGGVGKTTISCGLSLALAQSGSSVCLIDLDVGLNNVDVMLGVENRVVYDLYDCLMDRCRLKQALVSVTGVENLYILPSMRSFSEQIDNLKIKKLVSRLSEVFNFVIIDAPAGLGERLETALNLCGEAIVVVTPHTVSLRDADKIIAKIKGTGCSCGVIINRIRGDMVVRKEMLNHNQIEKLLKTQVVGVIPESDEINILSSIKFQKIAKTKIISAFNLLVQNIKLEKKVIYDYEGCYRGFMGIIRRNLKRSV